MFLQETNYILELASQLSGLYFMKLNLQTLKKIELKNLENILQVSNLELIVRSEMRKF